jgi:hypothetical protein
VEPQHALGVLRLELQTVTGHTPMTISRVFGPHPDVEVLLDTAMRAAGAPTPAPRRARSRQRFAQRVFPKSPISDDRTGVENGVRAERSLFGPSHLHLEHSSSSDSLATHCHTPRAWPVNP